MVNPASRVSTTTPASTIPHKKRAELLIECENDVAEIVDDQRQVIPFLVETIDPVQVDRSDMVGQEGGVEQVRVERLAVPHR